MSEPTKRKPRRAGCYRVEFIDQGLGHWAWLLIMNTPQGLWGESDMPIFTHRPTGYNFHSGNLRDLPRGLTYVEVKAPKGTV